jgi:hypothetical protein
MSTKIFFQNFASAEKLSPRCLKFQTDVMPGHIMAEAARTARPTGTNANALKKLGAKIVCVICQTVFAAKKKMIKP